MSLRRSGGKSKSGGGREYDKAGKSRRSGGRDIRLHP